MRFEQTIMFEFDLQILNDLRGASYTSTSASPFFLPCESPVWKKYEKHSETIMVCHSLMPVYGHSVAEPAKP